MFRDRWTNMHNQNLDWIIKVCKEAKQIAQNAYTYVYEHLDDFVDDWMQDDGTTIINDRVDQAVSDALADIDFSPVPITLAADMTEEDKIYLYMGNEAGYNTGDWYYWDGSAWTDGGIYGTGGVNATARNLLSYILNHAAYANNEDMTPYINALITALTTYVPMEFNITYTLTHTTSSVNTSTVSENDPFTCTLSAENGYELNTVTVTMGGVDITSSAYNNGTISIASVTGDIVITAASAYIVFSWTPADGENALYAVLPQNYKASTNPSFEFDPTLGLHVTNQSTGGYAGVASDNTYDMSSYEFEFVAYVVSYVSSNSGWYGLRISGSPSLIISSRHLIYNSDNSSYGTYTGTTGEDLTIKVTGNGITINGQDVGLTYQPAEPVKLICHGNGEFYFKSFKIKQVA